MKLEPEQIYEFRIAAENKAGVGPASDPTAPTMVKERVGEYIFINTKHQIIIEWIYISKMDQALRTYCFRFSTLLLLCYISHSCHIEQIS